MRMKKLLICLIVVVLLFDGVTVWAGLHKTLEKAQKKITKIMKVEEGTYYPDPADTNVTDDSTPELNFANPEHPLHNKIKMPDLKSQRKEKWKAKESEQPSAPPGTGDYYTWMQTSRNTAITGIYAQQEIAAASPPLGINWNFPFNSTKDQTIYAPTLMCPNYATMEAVTVHYQPAGNTTATHAFGIWDWRVGHSGWIVSKLINSTFLNNYVRSYPEGILYFVQVSIYPNGSNRDTTVYLWNFNANNGAGAWEIQKQHINESSGMPYGSAG